MKQMYQQIVISPYVFPGLKRVSQPKMDANKRDLYKTFIINHVCEGEQILFEWLKVKCARADQVITRRIIYSFLTRHCKLGLQDVGDVFNQDHSTVVYQLKQHENMMEMDRFYCHKYKKYQSEIIHFINNN